MRLLFLILSFCLITNCTKKSNKVIIPENLSMTFKTLMEAKTFSIGGTGEAGMPTKETIAFKKLFNHKKAKHLFLALWRNGNWEGKMYALCGLYYYDKKHYDAYVNSIVENNHGINLFSGCLLHNDKIKNLMYRTNINTLRLEDNKQTIQAYLKQHNLTNGFYPDFIGGGYPQLLIDYINSGDERIK